MPTLIQIGGVLPLDSSDTDSTLSFESTRTRENRRSARKSQTLSTNKSALRKSSLVNPSTPTISRNTKKRYLCFSGLSKDKENVNMANHNNSNKRASFASATSHNMLSDYDGDDESDMEIPYTQDLGLPDQVTALKAFTKEECSKEPLRPGDVITYNHPAYVAGTRQALRVARVIATNPRIEVPLELDNGDCLPKDTWIRRIKEFKKGSFVDHPGT
jgi:hypothetical protein